MVSAVVPVVTAVAPVVSTVQSIQGMQAKREIIDAKKDNLKAQTENIKADTAAADRIAATKLVERIESKISAAPNLTDPTRYQKYTSPSDSGGTKKLAGAAGLIFLLTRGA